MAKQFDSARLAGQIHQMLEIMASQGVEGAIIGPNGASAGIGNFAEVTRNMRFSEKVNYHGYPPGLFKSTYRTRENGIVHKWYKGLEMNEEEQLILDKSTDAIGFALDAERFLGSFSYRDSLKLPRETIDEIAENLVYWLHVRGYQVTPIPEDQVEEVKATYTFVHEPGAEVEWDRADRQFQEDVQRILDDGSKIALQSTRKRKSWKRTRYSQKRIRGEGYFHFVDAKSHRRNLIAQYQLQLSRLSQSGKFDYYAAHAALAYALDAERFLQSLPADDLTGDTETNAVNCCTNRMLVWLDEMGFKLVPIDPNGPQSNE